MRKQNEEDWGLLRRQFNLRLRYDQFYRFRRLAEEQGVSMNYFLVQLLEKAADELDGEI